MSKRNTIPIMTKYELTKILSTRAAEIANGDPITVPNPGTSNPHEIALMEYAAGKIPIKIKRTFPNGVCEVWNVNEFVKNIPP